MIVTENEIMDCMHDIALIHLRPGADPTRELNKDERRDVAMTVITALGFTGNEQE